VLLGESDCLGKLSWNCLTPPCSSPLVKRQFSYGSTPVRGVNIGGWLVLEPWITPSIFEQFSGGNAVDEYTLCQTAGSAAESILQAHWSSWVSLADFRKIASNGFNLVRIPIGYWAFQKYEQDPYVQGAADYLDIAIGWARQTGLKVWIDLHGEPTPRSVRPAGSTPDPVAQVHRDLRTVSTTRVNESAHLGGPRVIRYQSRRT